MVDNFAEGHDFDPNFHRRTATAPIITADNGAHYIEAALGELFSLVRYDEYPFGQKIKTVEKTVSCAALA
jgi:hypothetical protein